MTDKPDKPEEQQGFLGKMAGAVTGVAGMAVDSVVDAGTAASNKTVGFALSQLMSSMNYACEKIRSTDIHFKIKEE